MGRLKLPRLQQPPFPTGVDWANPITRSLVLAFDGGLARNFEQTRGGKNTITGSLIKPGDRGMASGFGTTYGTGTTDKIDTTLATDNAQRSWFFRLYASSFPTSRACDQGVNFGGVGGSGSSLCVIRTYSGAAQFALTTAPATNTWFDILFTWDSSGSALPLAYLNGVSVPLTQLIAISGSFTPGSAVVNIGNRSDGVRVWPGLIQVGYIWDRILTPNEALSLHQNWNQVWVPQRRDLFADSASGTNTSVNPGVGNLVLTGYAPTISQPQTAAPGVGNITLTGYAPTVAQAVNTNVVPDVGNIVITGQTPTVTQSVNQSATPGVGSVVLTGNAPTVTQTANQALVPNVGNIVLIGYAPTVTQASSSPNLIPDTGLITLTGYAPSVTQSNPIATSHRGGGRKRTREDLFADEPAPVEPRDLFAESLRRPYIAPKPAPFARLVLTKIVEASLPPAKAETFPNPALAVPPSPHLVSEDDSDEIPDEVIMLALI